MIQGYYVFFMYFVSKYVLNVITKYRYVLLFMV